MKARPLSGAALLLVPLFLGCEPCSKEGEDVRTVARFCETVAFEKTDLALERQVVALPEPVGKALRALRNSGQTAHTRYLSYLLLREYQYQIEQFGRGYSLGPGLPSLVVQELDRLLGQGGGLAAGGDRTSATYAAVILRSPGLFAKYPKGQVLADQVHNRLQRDKAN